MNDENVLKEARRPCIVLRLNGKFMYIFMMACPVAALSFVVLAGIIKDHRASTATGCGAWNLFPSISAAMSCCTPQKYIWQLLIAVHSAPRFLVAVMYYNHYMAFHISGSVTLYRFLVTVNSSLHIAENFCLLVLSIVMSDDNYYIHEKGFIGFMVFSESYMLLTLGVFRWSRSGRSWTETDLKSYRYKTILFIVNISAFFISIYFFLRHNWYCESGVYSVFAFLEYIVVLTNVAFHSTAIYEYGQGELVFSEDNINNLRIKSR